MAKGSRPLVFFKAGLQLAPPLEAAGSF